jgi:hypothetical protein
VAAGSAGQPPSNLSQLTSVPRGPPARTGWRPVIPGGETTDGAAKAWPACETAAEIAPSPMPLPSLSGSPPRHASIIEAAGPAASAGSWTGPAATRRGAAKR